MAERDLVAALRELVEAAISELGEPGPGYAQPVANAYDHLIEARSTLEALESGERVTLWRWKAGEDPGIDHARSIPGPQPSPWREMGHIIAAGNPRCEVATFARLPDTQGAEDE